MEETGWKLVHGDVFRPPRNPRLFVSLIGAGIQIFCCTGIVISKCTFSRSFWLHLRQVSSRTGKLDILNVEFSDKENPA